MAFFVGMIVALLLRQGLVWVLETTGVIEENVASDLATMPKWLLVAIVTIMIMSIAMFYVYFRWAGQPVERGVYSRRSLTRASAPH